MVLPPLWPPMAYSACYGPPMAMEAALYGCPVAEVIAEIGMQIESSAQAVAKLTDSDYESASDPESDPDAPLLLGRVCLHR